MTQFSTSEVDHQGLRRKAEPEVIKLTDYPGVGGCDGYYEVMREGDAFKIGPLNGDQGTAERVAEGMARITGHTWCVVAHRSTHETVAAFGVK